MSQHAFGRLRRFSVRFAVGLVAIAAVITASMQPAEASKVHTYPSWSPFPVPKTASVPVTDIRPGTAPSEQAMPQAIQPSPSWPPASSQMVDLASTATASLPDAKIRLGQAGALTVGRLPAGAPRSASKTARHAAAAHQLRVSVASHKTALAAGVDGELVSLTPLTPSAAARSASVALSYASFASAYGGDYASRLQLVQLPVCALTSPRKASCQRQTPITASANDTTDQLLVGDFVLPASPNDSPTASPMVLAAVSGPTSGAGDFRATSLSPSGSWSVGNTGAFTYSYPISSPPSVGGAAPGVALSYDSSSIDGRTSATNAQASWVGDGWDYTPGYIERSYKDCDDDGHAGDYDQCWAGDNATLSFGAHSGQLVPTGSGNQWRLRGDDGSIITELSGASNGLNSGSYWELTTNDGTRYFFGADHLPTSAGGTGADTSTQAAWGVPVFGDDAGEPCHGASFDASSCTQGWRWNLDFVLDPNHNITVYHYAAETNYYAAGTTHTRKSYVRAGYPTSISYGQQVADYLAKARPGAEIDFAVTGRCDAKSGFSCATAISASNASHFPDVPYDQNCASTGTCTNYAPTFWTTKALSKITTKVWDESLTTPGWSTVDTYTLAAPSFPDPGDFNQGGGAAKPSLWLSGITHTGSDTRGGGSAVTMNAITFTGSPLPNRVDGLNLNGVPEINRLRLTSIKTETGASITIGYDTGHTCDRNSPPTEDNDTARCYPVRWTPFGYSSPVLDWFYTYPVLEIDENDNGTLWGANQSPAHITHYAYSDPAWHRDDSPYTASNTRSWGQFRGYRNVTTTTGALPDPITKTVTSYLQGMDGDYRKDGTQRSVSVTSAAGDSITDSNAWSGFAYQTSTYSADGGSARAQTINIPWKSAGTASQTLTGLPDLIARFTGTARTDTRTLLANGSWRTSRVTTTYSTTTGLPTAVDDLGQIDASGNPLAGTTPEKCTTTSYATDTSRNMLTYPAQVITTAGGCATSTSSSTLSATKILYGTSTLGAIAASNGGDPTSVQALKAAPSTWSAAATTGYDTYGRPTSSTDPMGRHTTTSYGSTATTKKYLPVTTTVTNNAGWITTTTLDPGRQLLLSSTDANGRLTSETYDGLGRLTAVWLPNHAKVSYPSQPSLKYAYQVSASSFVAVTSSTLTDAAKYTTSIVIYDAMLQARQNQSSPRNGAATARLISNTGYDSHGWAVIADQEFYNADSAPTTTPNTTAFSGDIPAETRTSYDGQGRPTTTALWSNGAYAWQTSTAYPGADETDTTPPAGGITTRSITDARGQLTQLIQNPGGAQESHTYYSYDAAGHQTTIVGPLASGVSPTGSPLTWTSSYDALGNITHATDPDAGTTTRSYNNDSELVQTTTTGNETGATTQVLSYDHASDPLGRLTAEYNGTLASGTRIASWVYDAATGGKGQLASETEYAADGSTPTYTKLIAGYSPLYQPTSTTITVPAGAYGNSVAISYKTMYRYSRVLGNVTDQLITETGAGSLMPTEDYGIGYNAAGLPVASGGASAYETNTDYDPHGRVLRAVMGIMPYQVAETFSWDEPTGRLANATFSKEDGTSAVNDISYRYNPAGLITAASDAQGGTSTPVTDQQCYIYDGLQRLTQAWTDTGGLTTPASSVGARGACTHTSPATGNLGGPAPYWQTYAYDLTGNRTSRVEHSVSGGADATTVLAQDIGNPCLGSSETGVSSHRKRFGPVWFGGVHSQTCHHCCRCRGPYSGRGRSRLRRVQGLGVQAGGPLPR